MLKKIKILGSSGGVFLSNDDDLQAFLKKKGVQSLLDNEGFEVITFAPLVSGSTYTLGPQEVSRQPPLRIFDLVFQNIPTGSSGAPHIHQDLEDFPLDQLRPLQIQQCSTRLFRRHHQELNLGEGKVYYSREMQVQDHCDKVVKDVIESCRYDLKIDTEAALNGQKIDIGMLRTRNDAICGTMEVKQPWRKHAHPPDPNPMDHPKVVMQVLLQMIPLRTMYGVRNAYGVLSTYKCWRFFRWVPEGEVIDTGKDATTENIDYTTPRKKPSGRQRRVSPPMSPKPFCDSTENTEEEEEEEEDVSPTEFKQGTLYASEVIADGPRALGVLAWVLGEMENSPINDVPAHQRDYLYVVKKNSFGGYVKLEHTPEHYKGRMPSSRNETLYILEELGHRHKGRVFRAMSKNGNLCVLKYFVKGQHVLQPNGSRVEADVQTVAHKAVEYWNTAYASCNWLPSAVCGYWGGGVAMIMPDLEKMSLNVDREQALHMLMGTMERCFFKKNIWHADPAWRNVALVRNQADKISKVVMIDLEPQHMIEKDEVPIWDFQNMWEEFKGALEANWAPFEVTEKMDSSADDVEMLDSTSDGVAVASN